MKDRSRVEKAMTYVEKHGRKLEFLLIRNMIEPCEMSILEELGHYQNEDGGFGKCLESDFRMPYSSAIATEVAINIMATLELKDEKMIEKTLEYLAATYKAPINGWEIVPKEVDAYPHAVWWNYESISNFGPFNPSATLLGFMFKYGHGDFSFDIEGAIEQMLTSIIETKPMDIEEHALFCLMRLMTYLPLIMSNRIQNKVAEAIGHTIETDPTKWAAYAPEPIKYIESPQNALYETYKACVDLNVQDLLDTMTSEGVWPVKHQWYQYMDVFEKEAKEEWAGVFAWENLKRLRAYGV